MRNVCANQPVWMCLCIPCKFILRIHTATSQLEASHHIILRIHAATTQVTAAPCFLWFAICRYLMLFCLMLLSRCRMLMFAITHAQAEMCGGAKRNAPQQTIRVLHSKNYRHLLLTCCFSLALQHIASCRASPVDATCYLPFATICYMPTSFICNSL